MNTKRIIAGALSAAIITSSAAGIGPIPCKYLIEAVSASAASNTAGSVWAMYIADSEITFRNNYYKSGGRENIEFTSKASWKYEPAAKSYKCPAGKSKQDLSKHISGNALSRQTLQCTVTVPNNSAVNTAEKIKELVSLNVMNTCAGSSTSVNNTFGLEFTKNSKSSNNKKAVYTMTGTFISYYGDSTISLQFDSKLRDYEVSVSDCALISANSGYDYSKVTDSKGQNLHLSIMKSPDIDAKKYEEWLRSLGRYISSLSDITEITYKDIYISFDDPTVAQPSSCCDYIKDETGRSVGILIKFNPNTSRYQCEQIMAGMLDWGLLHELSHAYSRLNSNNKSYEAFGSAGDEGLVNVRALAAVQNCTQLKNKHICLNGRDLGNYIHALKNAADEHSTNALFDQLYIYDKYGSSFINGWATIENIMLGRNSEMNIDALNGAIDFISGSDGYDYGGSESSSICFDSRDTIRFINVLFALCQNHPDYGTSREDFRDFLNDYVGIEVFAHYYSEWTKDRNCYNKSIILHDINGDRVFDSNDLQALKDFAEGKRNLAPEGIYQADYNQDGYVNEHDITDLEDMWF